jgi:CBS domain-containing protein
LNAEGKLAGIITRGDLVRVLQDGSAATTTVLEAASTDVVVTYPKETLQEAIEKMLVHAVGRLPVVEKEHQGRVMGYLGRSEILAARLRLHDEENIRESGLQLSAAGPKKPR